MTVLWSPNNNQNNSIYGRDEADVADTGLADVGLPPPDSQSSLGASVGRPQLQRNQPQPPPPHQPPPPPAPQQIGNPNDSLSLMQLRRIVTEFPRIEPIAYAFSYADTASYEEEIDEWFSYSSAEFTRVRNAQETFDRRWKKFEPRSWSTADKETQKTFIRREITGLQATDLRRRCKSLQTLLHISLGVWDESAGAGDPTPETTEPNAEEKTKGRTAASKTQVESIRRGVLLITESGGVTQTFELLRRAFDRFCGDEYREPQVPEAEIALAQDELYNVTTIMYMLIESTRNDKEYFSAAYKELVSLNPELVNYLATVTAKLRWDDTNDLPQTRIFLLFWKSILLVFGGVSDVNEVKKVTSEKLPSEESPSDLITASPLDYHIFRQEITSKYPAYVPPAPLIPLELDNNSILPPLPNHPVRNTAANGILTPAKANSGGGSILHQPVHIATPAPSPPPSPPVGGKAGKKQNYQTNQNFPFMYPPLDSTSNSAGGKGTAGLQEMLVGRKWEGSDIPASILEAGELFAKRTRMTRAMRQLWDERERFLKFERGWDGKVAEDEIQELDLESAVADKLNIEEAKFTKPEMDYGPRRVSDEVKARLDAIEAFYGFTLPHLQSLVIVLLKAVLANVTALIMQPMQAPQPSLASGFQSEVNLRANGAQTQRRPQEPLNPPVPIPVEAADLPIEDLDALRTREITAKAVSGILLTLLKWFKVSHILKFEYLTQLLLDSNYLPLVLKLFAHQEVDKIVDTSSDRQELNFFAFCNSNSNRGTESNPITSNESEDDAAPPPIKLWRSVPPIDRAAEKAPASSSQDALKAPKKDPPEIDELGYPVNELPSEPKTDFSWRNFFSSINYLRIMQKICKNKAHRNLLLVQYKSSNILKKALKIPQHELRLYTLKLFKNQVPYCGRKWRQGNMRVITAVYLHCRPELRDDWLAGSDVDAEVEEALPLEQALRSLTHWHNIKRYPEQMGADVKILEEEHDFFVRELDKLDFGGGEDAAESVADGDWGLGGAANAW